MITTYACRNCNLVFSSGFNHGWGQSDGDGSRYFPYRSMLVCNACGWQYEQIIKSYSISQPYHPIKWFSNLLQSKAHRYIRDEMKLSDVYQWLQTRPQDQNLTMELYLIVEVASEESGYDVADLTIIEFKRLVKAFNRDVVELYAADNFNELVVVGLFWDHRDKKIETLPTISDSNNLRYALLHDVQTFYEHDMDENFAVLIPEHTISKVTCINCQKEGRIGFYDDEVVKNPDHTCPRCKQKSVESIGSVTT